MTRRFTPALICAAVFCVAPGAQAQTSAVTAQTTPPITPPIITPPTTTPATPVAGSTALTPSAIPMDPEKVKLIRQLLDVTGAAQLIRQSVEQMILAFKQSTPDASEDFWTKFRAQLHPDDLIAKFIPVYDKYYTKDDLQAIIAFYSTPAGKRMLATLPQITAESMQIGQDYGKHMAEEVLKQTQQASTSAPAPTKSK